MNSKFKPVPLASMGKLFSFVYQHYSTSWTSVLFYCLQTFENKIPVGAYSKAFLEEKLFRKTVDLSAFKPTSIDGTAQKSIDVIIPTLDRKKYLLQVLEDLNKQTFLPANVIIVEQDSEVESHTKLGDILSYKWSFNIIHVFTHQTGACNARNLALEKVESEWIFFADDDIRMEVDLLKKVMGEAATYKTSAFNLNCKQPGEETIFPKVKQWGSFGSGTSIVKTYFAKQCEFSLAFEHGNGEDADFGRQLRQLGCDIIYHPDLEILHLKAPNGGFRKKVSKKWDDEKLLPKPSPTVMVYAKKHYTEEQLNGFKISLFLKFYPKQKNKNPFTYLPKMKKRWKISEQWAEVLIELEKANFSLKE